MTDIRDYNQYPRHVRHWSDEANESYRRQTLVEVCYGCFGRGCNSCLFTGIYALLEYDGSVATYRKDDAGLILAAPYLQKQVVEIMKQLGTYPY